MAVYCYINADCIFILCGQNVNLLLILEGVIPLCGKIIYLL